LHLKYAIAMTRELKATKTRATRSMRGSFARLAASIFYRALPCPSESDRRNCNRNGGEGNHRCDDERYSYALECRPDQVIVGPPALRIEATAVWMSEAQSMIMARAPGLQRISLAHDPEKSTDLADEILRDMR
jgi:hypothetical protein